MTSTISSGNSIQKYLNWANTVKYFKPVARTASQLPLRHTLSSLLIHTELLCGYTFPETHKIEIPEKTQAVPWHILFTSQCLYYFALPLLKTFILLLLHTKLLNSCFWTKSFSIKELSFYFKLTCQTVIILPGFLSPLTCFKSANI